MTSLQLQIALFSTLLGVVSAYQIGTNIQPSVAGHHTINQCTPAVTRRAPHLCGHEPSIRKGGAAAASEAADRRGEHQQNPQQ